MDGGGLAQEKEGKRGDSSSVATRPSRSEHCSVPILRVLGKKSIFLHESEFREEEHQKVKLRKRKGSLRFPLQKHNNRKKGKKKNEIVGNPVYVEV